MNVIGDVRDKDCILFDDMVDTGGSLCNAAKALIEVGGAKSVQACASHGVLSGPAIDRINDSVITELALLDTIPAIDPKKSSKIKYLQVAPMFAEAIERIYQDPPSLPFWLEKRRARHFWRINNDWQGGEGNFPPWLTLQRVFSCC